MFKRDQAIIAKFGRASPDNMARVLTFVILTIRQPLTRVGGDLASVVDSQGDGRDINGILYGFKHHAWVEVWEQRETLYHCAEELAYHSEDNDRLADALVRLFSDIHGIGWIKAGFAAQLLYGVSGCVDTHNLDRYGLNATTFKYRQGQTTKTKARRARAYNALVNKLGGTEELWDSWCAYVAKGTAIHNQGWASADDVSAEHVRAILP